MKKFLLISLCCILSTTVYSAELLNLSNSDGLDPLRSEIIQLQQQLEQKQKKLNECATKNKNFKIAGVATVGLAGAGVITNVSLANDMKEQLKEAENLGQRFGEIVANADEKKLFDELDKTLTFTEKQRLKEIYESSGNIEVSETDRSLLQKVSAAAQKSQKEKGK